ncbi:precorrin-6y C5,15-methyltransferase (decarboxylating) subunit CbiE [Caldiplasma sukawensis]
MYNDVMLFVLSNAGIITGKKISEALKNHGFEVEFVSYSADTFNIKKVRDEFFKGRPIVLVMSLSGARSILDGVSFGKRYDPPVIVVDDAGRFVIPFYGTHGSGANRLASEISQWCEMTAVITDGAESIGRISIEEISKMLFCTIHNEESIIPVNSKIVNGNELRVKNETNLRVKSLKSILSKYEFIVEDPKEPDIVITEKPERSKNIAYLVPDNVSLGIGYRKATDFHIMEKAVIDTLNLLSLEMSDVDVFASVKADPPLIQMTEKYNKSNTVIKVEKLNEIGEKYNLSYSASAEHIGAIGVAEPAALASLGPGSELVMKKRKYEGYVTVAVATRKRLFYGKITFIGAGPGSSQFLTIKGIRSILDSDVVCGYEKPLKTASPYIGGKWVNQLKWKEQQKYVDMIIDLYKKGYNIVYLFTGDSCFTETELIRRFTATCENVCVIPGISSVQAASSISRMGLELVPVISFHLTGQIEDRKARLLKSVKKMGNAIVIPRPFDFMPDNICSWLIENGVDENIKCSVLQNISEPDEEIVNGTLKTISQNKCSHMSVMTIGEPLY